MGETSGSVTASPQSCTSKPTDRGPRSVSPVIMRRSMLLGGGSSPVFAEAFGELGHPVAEDALRDGERDLLLAVEVP